jgi:hypothetical protein
VPTVKFTLPSLTRFWWEVSNFETLWLGVGLCDRPHQLESLGDNDLNPWHSGTLFYLRQHWTLQSIAEVLDCSDATVWNYVHEMLPHLRNELPASLLEQWQQECPSVERAESEQWLSELPEGALLVDTWEQPILRPQVQQAQEEYYSGKQKEHTRKNKLITLPKGLDFWRME